jgi:hypothetical protein
MRPSSSPDDKFLLLMTSSVHGFRLRKGVIVRTNNCGGMMSDDDEEQAVGSC